jgi:hypothetical protein
MPGPRSWNRRETNIAQAGYFNVLRSTGWFFALSRLPGGYRYVVRGPATPDVLVKPAGITASADEQYRIGGHATETSLQILPADTSHRGLLRLALIALAAVALTFGLLWIAGGAPSLWQLLFK